MRSRFLSSPLLCLLGPISALVQEPDQKTKARVEWFINDAPAKWFGNTRHAITAALGVPVEVTVRLNPNPHDTSVSDSVFTLQYDSASFVIYSLAQSHHEFLVEATVKGSRYLRKSPLAFGTNLAHVRAYFGDASSGPRRVSCIRARGVLILCPGRVLHCRFATVVWWWSNGHTPST